MRNEDIFKKRETIGVMPIPPTNELLHPAWSLFMKYCAELGHGEMDNAPGSCGASVNPGTPTTSDNCGVASVVGVRSDGKALTALYPVGATVITWTATDHSGNMQCAQQNVIVTNSAPLVAITGPTSGALYVVNTAVSFTGSFTDNAGDSHTAFWTFDGVPQAGIVDETTHTVSATHTFDSA